MLKYRSEFIVEKQTEEQMETCEWNAIRLLLMMVWITQTNPVAKGVAVPEFCFGVAVLLSESVEILWRTQHLHFHPGWRLRSAKTSSQAYLSPQVLNLKIDGLVSSIFFSGRDNHSRLDIKNIFNKPTCFVRIFSVGCLGAAILIIQCCCSTKKCGFFFCFFNLSTCLCHFHHHFHSSNR